MFRHSKSLSLPLPLLFLLIQSNPALAASKPHVIAFGKWTSVQSSVDSAIRPAGDKPLTLKVRPLLVDARIKEFTLGLPHDVTDRLFVVRRAFRVNDSLPQESVLPPRWLWQRGGWLIVDRMTAHISAVNLPDFDPIYSAASWYRDYIAYCGVSEDGKRIYAVVVQISRRKPVLKKPLGAANLNAEAPDAAPDSACAIPAWQRGPARVSFESAGSPRQTFAIRGHSVDLVTAEEDDEEASK
jgi:hypothetical protein